MTESLQGMIRRVMREEGLDSVRALYRRLPDTRDRVTYETVRKLANGEQRGTRDSRVFRDLAIMLRVDENDVRTALNELPTYGDWELPPRAQSLNPDERATVMNVVDTILRAKGMAEPAAEPASQEPADEEPADAAGGQAAGNVTQLAATHDLGKDHPAWQPGYRPRAARRGTKRAVDQDQDLDENQDQGGSDDPA